MIYLLLAIAASTLVLVCFKIFERFGVDSLTAITLNYAVGALFGFGYAGGHLPMVTFPLPGWMVMSLITGTVLITGFISYAVSARRAGIAITAISGRMSVIIPVLMGIFVIGDSSGFVKIAGILLAFVAFYLTLKSEKALNINIQVLFITLAVFILTGINDSSIKITQHYFLPPDDDAAYVNYVASAFTVAFAIGALVTAFRLLKLKAGFKLNDLFAGIVLGLLNWFSVFNMIKGMTVIQVSVFLPLMNISVVVLSSLIGYFIFREKLKAVNWAGIALAVFAIYLIAAG